MISHQFGLRVAAALLPLLIGSVASAQHWYTYAPPPTEFDWQIFAPFSESIFDADEIAPVSEGYFFNMDRMHFWMSRPNGTAVGNAAGQNPIPVFIPNDIDYAYYDIAGNLTPSPVNDQPLVLLPVADSGSFGFQFNSITDANPRTASGWGNRFQIGWVGSEPRHHGGSTGWMLTVTSGLKMVDQERYGFDNKRLNQLGGAQGVDGVDSDPNLGTGPTAPTAGFPAIPHDDGLTTVHVNFNDPFNLLLGFTDVNGDQIPDDINGDGTNGTFGAFPTGDQVRLGVVFDDATVDSVTSLSGVQLSAIRRKKMLHGGAVAEMFLGARFVELSDRFRFFGRGGVLSDTEINNNVLNRIVGPEFGIRVAKQTRRWSTVVSGRFMAGANFMSTRQFGVIGDHLTTAGAVGSGNATGLPLSFGGNEFMNTFRTERFSPTGEFRVQGALHLTRGIKLQAAWEGLVLGGISRGANTVQYNLPSPAILSRSEVAFTHGITFGFMVNR